MNRKALMYAICALASLVAAMLLSVMFGWTIAFLAVGGFWLGWFLRAWQKKKGGHEVRPETYWGDISPEERDWREFDRRR